MVVIIFVFSKCLCKHIHTIQYISTVQVYPTKAERIHNVQGSIESVLLVS